MVGYGKIRDLTFPREIESAKLKKGWMRILLGFSGVVLLVTSCSETVAIDIKVL